jgi:hypothetical protein
MSTIPHSLSLQAERLRHTPWLDVIRNAWLVLLGGMLLKAMLPGDLAHSLHPLLLVAPLLVLVAKDLSHLPDAIARTRDALRARAWRKLPAAWLPPELVGLIRLDSELRRGFMSWLRRRPQPAAAEGRSFSYLELGAYRTVFAIVLFSTLVELPIHAAALPLFVHEPATLHLLHLLMLAAVLSTLSWVLGDRWLVGAGRHVLTEAGPAAAHRRPHPRRHSTAGDRRLRTHRRAGSCLAAAPRHRTPSRSQGFTCR